MPWTDKEFPAEYSSLQQPGCNNETVAWKRASQLCRNACLRGKHISAPIQGQLGDCWLMVAFHALSKCDETWMKVFGSGNDCVESGKVVINLYVNCRWEPIVIDDFLPVYKTQGCWELLNARNVVKSQFWAPLLEKACAKKFGCYQNLIAGQPSEGFLLLTGGYTWTEKLPQELTREAYDALRHKVVHFSKSNCVDSVFLNTTIPGVGKDDFEYHCYSVIPYKEENTLQFWNPLSNEANTGAISDIIATSQQSVPAVLPTITFATTRLSRIFEIPRCEWMEEFIDGQWNPSSSGGSVIRSTYCDNPQYCLCIDSVPDVLVLHVTLMQPSQRNSPERKYLLHAIGVHLYRTSHKPARKLAERQLKGLNCVACLHPNYQHCQNVSLYFCQKSGDERFSYFVIIPSTFMKTCLSEYTMRIVCNSQFKVALL